MCAKKKKEKQKGKPGPQVPDDLADDPLWSTLEPDINTPKNLVPSAVNILNRASRIDPIDPLGGSWPWVYCAASRKQLDELSDCAGVEDSRVVWLLSYHGYHLARKDYDEIGSGDDVVADAERIRHELMARNKQWVGELLGVGSKASLSTPPPWSLEYLKKLRRDKELTSLDSHRATALDCLHHCLRHLEKTRYWPSCTSYPFIDPRSIAWAAFRFPGLVQGGGSYGMLDDGDHYEDRVGSCRLAALAARRDHTTEVLKTFIEGETACRVLDTNPSSSPVWRAIFDRDKTSLQEAHAWLRNRAASVSEKKKFPRWQAVAPHAQPSFPRSKPDPAKHRLRPAPKKAKREPELLSISKSESGFGPMKLKMLEEIIDKEAFSESKALSCETLRHLVGSKSRDSIYNQWGSFTESMPGLFPTPGGKGKKGRYYSLKPFCLTE